MNVPLIAPYVNAMLDGVCPGWKKIILSEQLRPKLNKCLTQLNEYLLSKGVTNEHILKNGLESYIRPRPQNIFEPFKYFDPNHLRVIIIGQDPYTKLEEAQGLCFSVPSKNKSIPKSLHNIYHCLVNTGVIDSEDFPENGDLTNWAKQGVLLLNRYLTRSPNIKKDNKGGIWIDGNGNSDKEFLHTFWEDFTNSLIHYITHVFYNPLPTGPLNPVYVNHKNNYLAILLWGKIAQELEVFVNKDASECEIDVYTWTHPVSYAMAESDPRHFKHCKHFTKINNVLSSKKLPEINWNPCETQSNDLVNQFYGMTKQEIEIYLNMMLMQYKTGDFFPVLYKDKINEDLLIKIIEEAENIRKSRLDDPKFAKTEKKTKKLTPKSETPQIEETEQKIEQKTEPKKEKEETEQKTEQIRGKKRIISIDGACLGNGKNSAKASYGLYFPAKLANYTNSIEENCEGGLVPNKVLILHDLVLKETDEFIKATNGRAELLALIYAFLKVLTDYKKTGEKLPIIIIEDATYGLHMVNSRIWKYLLAAFDMPSIKTNRDLVIIIRDLLLKVVETVPSDKNYIYKENPNKNDIQLAWDILIQPNGKTYEKEGIDQDLAWSGLTMLHQNSHLDEKQVAKLKKIGGLELEKYYCNDKVDKFCNELLS